MLAFLRGLPRAAAFVAAAPLCAQSFLHDISLSGLGNGNPATSFGIAYEPVSGLLYVGVAGTLGAQNDVVAVIDPVTDTVIGTIQAQLFPEDIAFAYDAQGQLRYGAVTNGTSGSVTIWDANRQVVANVALPDPFGFGTCYPFGITPSEDQQRFYVSTQDGSGDVHAIDLATLALDPSESVNLPAKSGGRLRHRSNTLYVPWSEYDATFSGSSGGLTGWNTGPLPFFWERLTVDLSGTFTYPAGNDMEFLPDGRVVLGGTFFGNRLYFLFGNGELLRTLHLHTGSGSAHGLALSPDGSLLAVCDLAANDLELVDALNLAELSIQHVNTIGAGYHLPNDAVFAAGKLYVTCQGSEQVIVFDNLPTVTPGPGYGGAIAVSESTPSAGGQVVVSVTGPGLVALLQSDDDQGVTVHGVALGIGPAPVLVGTGNGSFSHVFRVPHSTPRGLNHFLQGVVDLKNMRTPTEPRVVVVQ